MKYYIGGYYLVEGTKIQSWMENKSLLPKMIWSISECISNIHPNIAALSWVNCLNEERQQYKQKLNLTNEEFGLLQEQTDKLFNDNKIGWGQVFLDKLEAIKFAKQYLTHIPNIKLLQIGLTEQDYGTFLEEEKILNNTSEGGVYTCLKSRLVLQLEGAFRGFEILGYENGSFHSFYCSSLQKDFFEKLNIKLNANGLIDDYSDAVAASNYSSDPKVGAETVLFMPWAVFEYQLS